VVEGRIAGRAVMPRGEALPAVEAAPTIVEAAQ
jgi:hypothetical protein